MSELEAILEDYRKTFKSEHGKRVLDDLTRFAKVFESTFDADPHVMAFREGRRETVLRILERAQGSPDEIIKRQYRRLGVDIDG